MVKKPIVCNTKKLKNNRAARGMAAYGIIGT